MPVKTVSILASGDDGNVGRESAGTEYPPTGPLYVSVSGPPSEAVTSMMVRKYHPSWCEVSIAFMRFDTSVLPDDAVITSAVLRLYHSQGSGATNRDICIAYQDPAVWPLGTEEFSMSSTPLADAARLPIANLVIGQSVDIPLSNLSNISKTGYTAFRMEVDGGDPGATSYTRHFAEVDNATLPEPKLEITFTTSEPSIECPTLASGDDGYVGLVGTTFQGSGSGSEVNVDEQGFLVRSSVFGGPLYVYTNGMLRFDTSAIPDDATIFACELVIKSTGDKQDVNARSLCWEWVADWDPLSTADHSFVVSATAMFPKALSTIAINTVHTWELLNPDANINKNGYTALRGHITGVAPTGLNHIFFHSWDHPTEPAPKLVVYYTVPPATRQQLRPDADLATAGWSTAPLWSKIDEDTPDGVTITGVAS